MKGLRLCEFVKLDDEEVSQVRNFCCFLVSEKGVSCKAMTSFFEADQSGLGLILASAWDLGDAWVQLYRFNQQTSYINNHVAWKLVQASRGQ